MNSDESFNVGESNRWESKRIVTFLVITFIITYVVEIFGIGSLVKSTNQNLLVIAQLLLSFVMLIPSIGVILTRIITKEGFKDLWIRPNIKGNIKYYIFAWFGMIVLTIVGVVIYFVIFPKNFDSKMTNLVNTYQASGLSISIEDVKKGMYVQILMAVFFAPVLNALFCFGEEWAWRGYLLPKMMHKFKLLPMLLINGVIWGLWHAPITALGHNYGIGYMGFPFTGIFAMCIFCTVVGTIFSYLTIRTKSCIPAVIAHGSMNGFAAIGTYLTVDGGNPFIGPAPTGIIGGIGFIVTAVILYIFLNKDVTR